MTAGTVIPDDPDEFMLVAQALVEGLVLVTVDDEVRRYDVPVLPPRRSRG